MTKKAPRRPDPEPYEVDDVLVVGGGTILWLVAGLAMLPFWDHFKAQGHLWWIATCFAGAALGLVGLRVALRRRRALRSLAQLPPST